MREFLQLDPNVRCWALVGRFLQHWALMEAALKNAVAKALGLDLIQEAILTNNLQLRDKIHILRTAVDIASIHPGTERVRFKKILKDIGEYSPTRNMMAHDVFAPHDDGVKFLIIKAKGSLQFPTTNWGVKEFSEAYDKLMMFTESVEELQSKLLDARLASAIAKAQARATTEPTNALALLAGLYQIAPADPDSDSNSPGTQEVPQTSEIKNS